ncbi:MAG: MATE family efflux transporter [Lachnospiraceae bacterium]|nr:MATE family efflux transporter [Lachnospiraceae bacterium]
MFRKTDKVDLLSYIRNGQELSTRQKIYLVVTLSTPSVLAQLTSVLMQYIDASMVGKMGADASAAIGLVASTTWLFGGVCSSGAAGFSIQAAQYIGAKNFEKAREVLRQSLVAILLFTVVLAAIGAAISFSLPVWLGGAKEIQWEASLYFLIYVCSLPAMGMGRLAGSMLQCSGNMKIPGILNSLMCVMDVIFNACLIFESFTVSFAGVQLRLPGAGLGVAGAALGTALAHIVTAVLMLYFLCFRSSIFKLQRGESFRLQKPCIKRAVTISLPIAVERVVVSGAMVVATRIVAPLGITAIAANSFAITAESLCYMPGYGIADAATTLTGQSIGAGRNKLAVSFGRITVGLGMAIMACTGALMFFAAPFMIGILTPNAAVRELGIQILRIEAYAEPLFGASIVVAGVLRGAGDTLVPSIMNFVSLWAVRLVLSYFLAKPYGLVGVWIAMAVELCFRGIIFLIRFERKKWLRIKM